MTTCFPSRNDCEEFGLTSYKPEARPVIKTTVYEEAEEESLSSYGRQPKN